MSNQRIIRVNTLAGILGLVPALTGMQPGTAVVVVALDGSRSGTSPTRLAVSRPAGSTTTGSSGICGSS